MTTKHKTTLRVSAKTAGVMATTAIAFAQEVGAERDKLRQINAELVGILSRILRAHESGNNGLVMGEAVLCEAFAILAREALAKAGK